MLEKLIDLLLSTSYRISGIGVKISSSLEGMTIFIPWTVKRTTVPAPSMTSGGFTAGPKALTKLTNPRPQTKRSVGSANATSPFSSRIVTLSQEDLEREKERILGIARALPQDDQGEVRLIPWLHLTQCWDIISHLRRNGISVRPNSRKDADGLVKFFFESDGAVILWFRRGFIPRDKQSIQLPHDPPAAQPEPVRAFLPPAEKLLADSKEETAGRPDFGQSKNRSEPTSGGINQVLRTVQKDLRSRGVDRLPLDWSLAKPVRSHLGSKFLKKRAGSRDDDRFREKA
jgi:hypothetical protein